MSPFLPGTQTLRFEHRETCFDTFQNLPQPGISGNQLFIQALNGDQSQALQIYR